MQRVSASITPWLWTVPAVVAGVLASFLLLPQPTVEAKPLGAVREFSVTLKAPDLIVPNTFAVNVGDTIRFRVTQEGPAPHNLHIGGNGVDVESPTWTAGSVGVWEYTFSRPGVYALYCSVGARGQPLGILHRHVGPMEGVIVVTDAGAPAPDLSRWQARNVRLGSLGGSGVTGTAHLQQSADGSIRVRVEASGLRPGTFYLSGLYDRRSVNCVGGLIGGLAGFATPLQPRQDGTAQILYTTSGPIDNWFSVSIREGAAAPGSPVACGDTSSTVLGVGATPAAPAPAALPRTGDADLRGLLLAALALSALTLGLGLMARRGAAA